LNLGSRLDNPVKEFSKNTCIWFQNKKKYQTKFPKEINLQNFLGGGKINLIWQTGFLFSSADTSFESFFLVMQFSKRILSKKKCRRKNYASLEFIILVSQFFFLYFSFRVLHKVLTKRTVPLFNFVKCFNFQEFHEFVWRKKGNKNLNCFIKMIN
jgi:hypothetical protein